jgi:hypothetical protein
LQFVPTTENFNWSQHPEEGTPKGGSTHKRELISNEENMDPHTKLLPFHLVSGLKKIVLTPDWISVLNLNSQKNCLHQIYLYQFWKF